MDQFSDIMVFSRNLFILSRDETEILEADENDFLWKILDLVEAYSDGYCGHFYKLYRKHDQERVVTQEHFLSYTIPRCLNLYEDENYYYSFILVASFIYELLNYRSLRRHNNELFLSTAYKGLVAVFKRKFEEKFEENGGWRGLESFCASLPEPRSDTKYKLIVDTLTHGDKVHRNRVFKLIKECEDQHVDQFALNDYERYLISLDNNLPEQGDHESVSQPEKDSRKLKKMLRKVSKLSLGNNNKEEYVRQRSTSPSASDSERDSDSDACCYVSENESCSDSDSEIDCEINSDSKCASTNANLNEVGQLIEQFASDSDCEINSESDSDSKLCQKSTGNKSVSTNGNMNEVGQLKEQSQKSFPVMHGKPKMKRKRRG